MLALLPQTSSSQQPLRQDQPIRSRLRSELTIDAGTSAGNIRICCFAEDRRLQIIGLEYAHVWGHTLGGQLDYTGEAMPLVVMNEPARYGLDSVALTTARRNHFGFGLGPGVRMTWRERSAFRPYLIAKGGPLYFTNRILSAESMKLNYFGEYGGGIATTLGSGLGLRLSCGDIHISNGDVARRNPGIDLIYINTGWSFTLHGFGRPW